LKALSAVTMIGALTPQDRSRLAAASALVTISSVRLATRRVSHRSSRESWPASTA
jgi:hypothetical protein